MGGGILMPLEDGHDKHVVFGTSTYNIVQGAPSNTLQIPERPVAAFLEVPLFLTFPRKKMGK